MSYPWCRFCRRDVLPGVGCACRELYESAREEEQRERRAEQEYFDQMDASIAAERRRIDEDAAADLEYEARRARAREDYQARVDFARGDDR